MPSISSDILTSGEAAMYHTQYTIQYKLFQCIEDVNPLVGTHPSSVRLICLSFSLIVHFLFFSGEPRLFRKLGGCMSCMTKLRSYSVWYCGPLSNQQSLVTKDAPSIDTYWSRRSPSPSPRNKIWLRPRPTDVHSSQTSSLPFLALVPTFKRAECGVRCTSTSPMIGRQRVGRPRRSKISTTCHYSVRRLP
jgi:hypothetical protein